MHASRPLARRHPHSRGGFTLIELLVVIVVIGILIALLVPAVGAAIGRARETRVVSEMSTLDAALVNFKSKYGVDVPSFIVLYESSANWAPTNPAGAVSDAAHRASRAFIQQAWPDFDVSYGGANQLDINGDNDADDVLILNGAECLAFFLGGICETNIVDMQGALRSGATAGSTVTWWNPLGFSTNPRIPFAKGGSRVPPFARLEGGPSGRLRDFFVTPDEDMPEYYDPLPGQQRPYLYLSSYGGRGYQIKGADGVALNADDDLPPASQGAIGTIYYSDSGLTTPFSPQSYQLISPGIDFAYGGGGFYNGTSSTGTQDRDNITNFKNGRLN